MLPLPWREGASNRMQFDCEGEGGNSSLNYFSRTFSNVASEGGVSPSPKNFAKAKFLPPPTRGGGIQFCAHTSNTRAMLDMVPSVRP